MKDTKNMDLKALMIRGPVSKARLTQNDDNALNNKRKTKREK